MLTRKCLGAALPDAYREFLIIHDETVDTENTGVGRPPVAPLAISPEQQTAPDQIDGTNDDGRPGWTPLPFLVIFVLAPQRADRNQRFARNRGRGECSFHGIIVVERFDTSLSLLPPTYTALRFFAVLTRRSVALRFMWGDPTVLSVKELISSASEIALCFHEPEEARGSEEETKLILP